MSPLLLLGSALVPTFLLLWYFYSRDEHPEPRGVVFMTFLLGTFIPIPVIPLELVMDAMLSGVHGFWSKALTRAFFGAAIPEEVFKFLVLRHYAMKQSAFDEPMDGIVYGATASLGFAALENLLYVGQGGLGVAMMRALSAVPFHAFNGVIMGAYAGRSWGAEPSQRSGLLARGLLYAILLHGAYDGFLMTESGYSALGLLVLFIQIGWGRHLINRLHTEQVALMQMTVASTSTSVSVGTNEVAQPVLEAVEVKSSVAVATAAVPIGRHRTLWARLKLMMGGAVASFGTLLLLLIGVAYLDAAGEDETRLGLIIIAIVVALPTVGSMFLFRSGLRGPFEVPAFAPR
jgi:RsiW-degrading membrane proteinase PrsW (M82 family)